MDYNITYEYRARILNLLFKNDMRPHAEVVLYANNSYKFMASVAYEHNIECWIYVVNKEMCLVFFGNLIAGTNFAYRLDARAKSGNEWLMLIRAREDARRARELLKGNKSLSSKGNNVWATSKVVHNV